VKAITQNVIAVLFSTILISSAAIAAYLQEPFILLIPFGLLACCYLLQNLSVLFYVLIISIPWSIEYNFSNDLGTDLPDEPLMLLTSLSALLLLVCKRHNRNKKIHFLASVIILQLLWTLITVILSAHTIVSVKYLLAKSWYLLAFLVTPLILFRDKERLVRSFQVLILSTLSVVILVIIKHASYSFTFEKINVALNPWFRNHVNYSSLIVCIIPILIAGYKLETNKSLRLSYIIALVVILSALILSYSRGAWLAVLTGTSVYWLLRKKALFLTYCFFILLCTGCVLWLGKEDRYVQFSRDFNTTIFHKNFKEHLIATYELKDMSTTERFYRWIAAVRMVGDSWPAGFGPATFYDQYKDYTVPAFKTWVSNNQEHSTVHNYFLLLITEQGVAGLFIFLLLLGSMFWYAQTIYHRTHDPFSQTIITAMAVMLMMICTIIFLSDMIETDKLGSLFYICLAVIITIDRKTKALDPASNIQRIP
jgi:hypothetical protein